MIRKVMLGLSVALAIATGNLVAAASAQAGPLTRVKNAVHANLQGGARAVHDLACGQGARQAVRDVVDGAKLGVTFLRGGGGGFAKQKPC
jgi:hypothetical protein